MNVERLYVFYAIMLGFSYTDKSLRATIFLLLIITLAFVCILRHG